MGVDDMRRLEGKIDTLTMDIREYFRMISYRIDSLEEKLGKQASAYPESRPGGMRSSVVSIQGASMERGNNDKTPTTPNPYVQAQSGLTSSSNLGKNIDDGTGTPQGSNVQRKREPYHYPTHSREELVIEEVVQRASKRSIPEEEDEIGVAAMKRSQGGSAHGGDSRTPNRLDKTSSGRIIGHRAQHEEFKREHRESRDGFGGDAIGTSNTMSCRLKFRQIMTTNKEKG